MIYKELIKDCSPPTDLMSNIMWSALARRDLKPPVDNNVIP